MFPGKGDGPDVSEFDPATRGLYDNPKSSAPVGASNLDPFDMG